MVQAGSDDVVLVPRNERAQRTAAPRKEAPAQAVARTGSLVGKKAPAKLAAQSDPARAQSAAPDPAPVKAVAAAPDASRETKGSAPVDWEAQDWNDLVPRLYRVAIWQLRRLQGTVQRVAEAQDLVNDAIAKTIARVRIWNPDNCTLYQHLVGVIFSDISHALNSPEHRLIVPNHDRPEDDSTWPPDIADAAPNQEEIWVYSSDQRRLLDHFHRIDPRMARMARLMLRDVTETVKLCRLLGLAPSEVANLRKRLKRAARTYFAENRS